MQDNMPPQGASSVVRRTFLALNVPDDIAAALASEVPVAPHAARIVHPSDMHLTLHFLGDQPGDALNALTAALAARLPPLSGGLVRLTRTFALPSAHRPRLVAAEAQVDARLQALREQITDTLESLCPQWPSLAPERRPWRPHVTLYWLKRRREHPLPLGLPLGYCFDAERVGLYHSRPNQVPRYHRIAEWRLRHDTD